MASQEQEQQYSVTLEQIIRQYETMGQLMPQQQAALDQVGAGGIKAQMGLKVAGKGAVELGKVFTTALEAMYEGKQGFTAFNSAIDQTVTLLGVLSVGLAIVNPLLGIAAAGLTAVTAAGAKYLKATSEQSDKLYETFQQMSRVGGAASDGLQGLYRDVQRLGGGIQNLGEFAQLVSANAPAFASFAGTVYEGRQRFAELGEAMAPYRSALMNAGLSQKEQNEGLASFIRLQSRLGLIQGESTAKLSQGVRRYLIEQETLTKLTGANRKQQEDARSALQNMEQFQAKVLELRRRGMAGQAKKLEDAFIMLGGESNEVALGFIASINGNVRDANAAKLNFATNGEARRAAQLLAEGLIEPAEAADLVAQALKRNIDANGELQGKYQTYNETSGNLTHQMEVISRLLTGGFQQAQAAADRMGEQMGITGNTALDAEIQRQTDNRLSQVRAMQNMQNFVRAGSEATRAVSFFGKVVEKISNLFGLLGGGKFAKEYEAEKKARSDLVKKEEEFARSTEAVIAARKKVSTAKNAEEAELFKRELAVVEEQATNVMRERDALQQQIERGEFGTAAAPPPPPPGYDYDQAATDMQGTAPGEIGQRPATPARPAAAAPAAPAKMGQFNRMPGASTAGGVAAPAAAPAAPTAAAPTAAAPTAPTAAAPTAAAPTAAAPTAAAPARPAAPAAAPVGPRPDYSAEGKSTGGGGGGGQREPSRPAPAAGQQGSPRRKTEGIVFHHTGGRGLNAAVSTLKSRGLAYHYMLDRDGTVAPFMNPGAVAYHAGKTDKNPKFGNWNTLGIAAVAKDNTDVTKEQMAAAMNLTRDLASNFGFSTQNVFGHGAVSSAKMADEGKALVDAVKGGMSTAESTMPQARDGGVFDGPMSGYRAMLHGNEAVIPLKRGSVPVTMPRDFTDTMAKVRVMLEQFGRDSNTSGADPTTADQLNMAADEVINSRNEMMSAFREMMTEIRNQSQATRSMMENVVRAQETTNNVSQRILRTAS